jgi:hypothetical protein
MRERISQPMPGVPTAAKTKIEITITISRNAVPQRTWSWLKRAADSASTGSPAS